MISSKRSIIILTVGAVIFLLLVLGSWMFYSVISRESDLIIDATNQIALATEKEREFDESSANLKKYEADIKKLNAVFLNESTFVSFLQTMEGIARKAPVEFKAVGAALPTAANDSAIFSFQVKGATTELVRFFILLDKIPYTGMVQNMRWIRQGKGSGEIIVTGDYQIFNYIK